MNILLLQPEDHWLDATTVRISDRRAVHLRQVLRSVVGETIRVGLMGGQRGDGRIEAIDASGITLTIALNEPPPARHRFDVVLALPRPKMLRRILRTVAEFGVCNLHLINSARVEKSFWQTPLLGADKVKESLMAGMERARDTVAPVVISTGCFALLWRINCQRSAPVVPAGWRKWDLRWPLRRPPPDRRW